MVHRRQLSIVDKPRYTHLSSEEVIAMEKKYSANNYAPVPAVFASAKGVVVHDSEGKEYIDCLAGYSAVNQGHCHPELMKIMTEQMKCCTLSARAFYNNKFCEYAEFVTKFFGYEKVLPTNTGAEAVETAIKLSRKWAYHVKGVEEDKAIIVGCENNFHGRTFGAISLSTDPESYGSYGPLLSGFKKIPFDDADALETYLSKEGKQVAAFLVEPIQGEGGVIIPKPGYLKRVSEICTKYNVLLIGDEVQTGLGRTGKLLCLDYENVRPDVLILGKALSGGMYPVSAVLADAHIMDVIKPGTHGSTFGGNPLGSVVAIESLRVLVKEKMIENSYAMGKKLRTNFLEIQKEFDFIAEVRGLGLMNAVQCDITADSKIAYKLTDACRNGGLLLKPTHCHTIRLTPPLIINESQVNKVANVFREACKKICVRL